MRLLKNSGKATKRFTALFLAFSIICATIIASAAIKLLPDNSTDAENNATPKYYNVIENWNSDPDSDSNNADEQIFAYQYKTDNTYAKWQNLDYYRTGYWYNDYNLNREDFPSLTDEQWKAISKDGAGKTFPAQWMLATSASGYMHLRNYANNMVKLTTIPAVAYLFKSDIDGYVNINAGKITLFSKNIAEKGYKALLRITKNGENVYPANGYMELDDNTAATYPELDFEVKKGDEIRFELTANVNPTKSENDSVWVIWNPYISIRGDEYLYTETDDIYNGLTSYMDNYFKNQNAENMTATNALDRAVENSKRSKYGVYTALDSVYSSGVIPSEEGSVWKYATASNIYAGFNIPQADYSISCALVENGINVSWENADTTGLDAIKAVCDGKSYTYIVQKGQNNITLPLSSEKDIKIQLNGKNGSSEIVSVTKSGTTVIANTTAKADVTYLTSAKKEGTGTSISYKISGNVLSDYKIYYSTSDVKSKEAAESHRRSIIFNAVNGEQMMFGFSATIDGDYEIAAPIQSESAGETYYGILKQSLSGEFTVIDTINKYSENKNGFVSLVNLKAGETVWLNAYSLADAKINIGIPRVTYKPSVTDNNGIFAYKYRAVDYVENNAFNKLSYSSASLTNKEGAIWEFGSFENPIKTENGVTDYDTLGFTDLKSGDDASKITAILKPYEILRGNRWFNPLSMVVKADGSIYATHANGVAGTLHTTLGTSYNDRNNVGLPLLSKGFMVSVGVGNGFDNVEHNMGIYMKFTAPTSGNVTLNLSDFVEARTATHIVILKGNEVVKTYLSIIPKGETVDLGYMDKGEKTYICYGVDTKSKPYNYGGFPIATVSGEKSTVSFNGGFSLSQNGNKQLLTKNGVLKLPNYSRTIGKTSIGWTDSSGNYYSVGRNYTIKKDTTFTMKERNYGDITGDSNINASDISIIRQNLIGGKVSLPTVSDLNSDGVFTLKDLVRMKKWLAGYAVPFNQE